MSGKRRNLGLVQSEGARREEALFEPGSMEVQGLNSPSPVSLGCKTLAPCFQKNRTRPREHHLTMEKQSKPQRWVWSDECSLRVCCFPWACRLRVLLILLRLHFLLHLPAPRSLTAGELTGLSPQPCSGALQQERPRLFQRSQRPTERRWWRQRRPSSAQSDITASSHPCCTGTQRTRQERDAAALARH